jgi:DNA-binding TFAR19-related protein (PDSD5 family)
MKPTMLAMFAGEPELAGMVEEQLVQLAGSQKVAPV